MIVITPLLTDWTHCLSVTTPRLMIALRLEKVRLANLIPKSGAIGAWAWA